MSRLRKPSGRGELFNRGRNSNSYRRPIGHRSQRKTILIMCEGSATEPNYFEALKSLRRLRSVRVEVVRGGKGKVTPINLVSEAIEKIHLMDWNSDNDEVWCVFDVEGPGENPSIQRAIAIARRKKIKLAISNPACEYWFLLHFVCSNREFTNGQEIKQALRVYIHNYEEAMNVFPLLQENTQQAIVNANKLREKSADRWENHPNPSTGIDILVSLLLSLEN